MTKIIRKTTLIRNILIELIDSNVVEPPHAHTHTHSRSRQQALGFRVEGFKVYSLRAEPR